MKCWIQCCSYCLNYLIIWTTQCHPMLATFPLLFWVHTLSAKLYVVPGFFVFCFLFFFFENAKSNSALIRFNLILTSTTPGIVGFDQSISTRVGASRHSCQLYRTWCHQNQIQWSTLEEWRCCWTSTERWELYEFKISLTFVILIFTRTSTDVFALTDIPLQRFGTSEECAAVMAFLGSSDAGWMLHVYWVVHEGSIICSMIHLHPILTFPLVLILVVNRQPTSPVKPSWRVVEFPHAYELICSYQYNSTAQS